MKVYYQSELYMRKRRFRVGDFLQDNLSELWEDCRPDRLKECIGRLYEKISSIRYFKGVKKKKSR